MKTLTSLLLLLALSSTFTSCNGKRGYVQKLPYSIPSKHQNHY